ncbi:hypothetical protein N9E25_16215 [Verrucomicrobiales bacterium]|nr:hypothetical protein [Verrucomicrobiales bacterium]MDB2496117.1 hypothetical protein [Verrucomicrobiales bacterium]MDC3353392.1 hypothetical protein [Verrucomicrobiales bacterium]
MKKPLQSITLILAAIAFALIPVSCTDDEHDHDHDHDHAHADGHDHAHAEGEEHDHGHEHGGIEDGPNGGRLLTTVEPHLEFFVTDDRKVQITSIDEEEKAQPIGEQVVKVIGGSRSNPIRLSFAKQGDVLMSDIAFPEGNDFPVVVQIKNTADGETVTEKFNLNLVQCPECPNKEYACTCDHEH